MAVVGPGAAFNRQQADEAAIILRVDRKTLTLPASEYGVYGWEATTSGVLWKPLPKTRTDSRPLSR